MYVIYIYIQCMCIYIYIILYYTHVISSKLHVIAVQVIRHQVDQHLGPRNDLGFTAFPAETEKRWGLPSMVQ